MKDLIVSMVFVDILDARSNFHAVRTGIATDDAKAYAVSRGIEDQFRHRKRVGNFSTGALEESDMFMINMSPGKPTFCSFKTGGE